ncbi:unnamed protein product [Closterium sp. Yama58-4]|nr:unnamed protein product [Closterium sp. Yama58-4]
MPSFLQGTNQTPDSVLLILPLLFFPRVYPPSPPLPLNSLSPYRYLRVPVSVHGIARFSFSELCANTLGPPDYLALALRYHTLFLSEIPVLSRSVHDQARRFLTLTDELYNHRCLLVCSAAAAPNKLFKGLLERVGSGGVREPGGGGEGGGRGGEGRVDVEGEVEKEEGGIVPRIDLESLQFESEVGGSRLRRDVLAEGGRSALTSSSTLPVRQLSGREEEFAFHRAVSRLLEMQSERYYRLHCQVRRVLTP